MSTEEKSPKKQKTSPVVLYSYWRSSCSWRVRMALAFKEIEYQYEAVNLLQNQQHQDDYKSKNPMQQVPTLEIDGHTLTESMAILEYLEETRPNPSLLPVDPYRRAQVRRIVQMIVAGMQPLQNFHVLKRVGDEKKMEWGKYFIERGFEALEKCLAEDPATGMFCIGDQTTFADICLVPQVYNARRFGIDMSKFPIIERIEVAMLSLPVVRLSHPDNQPDKPAQA